ncbi:DNA-binding transcriptional activator of the SARP family [Micromonospora phaseoli]|uniref:DNA-binding transcriptional activator of the SARP family n=1 Tax=Micromonospora phaseoli TaxID=1144548 RepID=A0A1H6UE92_9ACTN|nr:BTAD domain-containing putative transcriptional regulator [Micromonospora phaseoli]PZV98846.1 DNA-binding SARP family transcriptional activator [Micromonospora phaseoli]GIJ76403.1 SARP family transcriptional regulator [Micromonospora phaseoli]SEI86500.1 DNA-binding transcriptional activator of the SARP family [Micromonospora phaseoli]
MVAVFRLLGDVEAFVDGNAVDLGHVRQRCVLAVLLVDANKIVHVDQLLDRVWVNGPPQRAHSALYSYLSRLRRCLSGAEDVDIVRRQGGYLLNVDPMAVDLHRFKELVSRARRTTDDEHALRHFDEAIDLWRGEPFARLDTPWFNILRTELHQARLTAERDRTDIALRRGQHSTLLSELSRGVAEQPLDERLAGQLMLALSRSGRQAEALDRYQRIRHRLADELGVDPGTDLQELHLRILHGDREVAASAVTSTPTGPAAAGTPRQLPPPPANFAGRVRELAALTAAVDRQADTGSGVAISAVGGMGGIGKTWLALRWAHDNLDRFPDGQLYVNLRGFEPSVAAMPPEMALRGFLDALGVPPGSVPLDLDAQIGLYRSTVSGRRMLIVLDNARDAEQVRPLLPGIPGCAVLVTSRQQLSGLVAAEGADPVTLDLLTAAEARELLASRLGGDRVAAEPRAVEGIVERCSGLPLALAIVAARAAAHPGFPLAALDQELAQMKDSLDGFAGSGDTATDLRSVFSWSCRALGEPAARLFRLLGLHPGPDISVPAAASLAALSGRQVRPVLSELSRAQLLVERAPGRYTCHDLLRAYAAEMVESEPAELRRAALHRIVDHYLRSARCADGRLSPLRDPIVPPPAQAGVAPEEPADNAQALAWFGEEHAVLMRVVELAARHGLGQHVWQLAWTLTTFLSRRSHWEDLIVVQRHALAATERHSDRAARAQAHRDVVPAYCETGRFELARGHLEQALVLLDELDDQVGQAHTLLTLSWLSEREGDQVAALRHDERSLRLFRDNGHQAGEARALNAVGWDHAMLGEHAETIPYCQRAVALQRRLGDRVGEANSWDTLGYAHHHLGHFRRAARCYRQALSLSRELGHRYNEAQALRHLGDTQQALGDLDAARDCWLRALEILVEVGHPEVEQLRDDLAASHVAAP